jgi:N-acetylglucosamine-6-phosphate deacetylase
VADGTRCVAADGTLAGSNLTMAAAVRGAEHLLGVDRATAIRMASEVPASILAMSGELGAIRAGMRADLLLVDDEMKVLETWIAGERRA